MLNAKEDQRQFTLGQLLGQVCRLVGGRMRMKLESIGLHHAQGLILFQLWHHDGLAQNALAQALHITPPTATNTLQRMERDGWIERRRDATDHRVVRVYLTAKASVLREEVRASFRDLDQELTSMLTEKECGILMGSLLKVRHLLSEGVTDIGRSRRGQGSPVDTVKEGR